MRAADSGDRIAAVLIGAVVTRAYRVGKLIKHSDLRILLHKFFHERRRGGGGAMEGEK